MDAQAWLDADVSAIEGVSARAAGLLHSAFGIATVRDLIEHYPRAYRDIGAQQPISDAPLGEQVTIVGSILRWNVIRPASGAPRSGGRRPSARGRRGLVIAKLTLADERGDRVEVPFFNQEWRSRQHPPGTRVAVSGVLERFRSTLQLKNAKLVVLGSDGSAAAFEAEGQAEQLDRVQAVYPATEALPSWRIARFVAAALEQLPGVEDFLPEQLRAGHGLIDLDAAIRSIHRPAELGTQDPARQRLVYDELLCLQVGLQQRRQRLESEAAGLDNAPQPGGAESRFLEFLPFRLTGAQAAALAEIGADLGRPRPMHRLLQGDVGSGKTVVAAWAMLAALDRGRQAVLMAPTEILAEQHFRTFTAMLAPLGVNAPAGPRLELLTGSAPAKRLRGLLAELAVGDVQLLIGTHALLEERVAFADLGVVVIDEQHRFGVEHRTRLRDKRADGSLPDVLVMTATPIPRSLALTVYGDLDVTLLDELPPGRQEIITQVIPSDSPRRERLYEFIRERVAAGERAYVVCPLVEPSEALDVAAAQDVHQRLSTEVFADLDVGLVHGRLPSGERDQVMERFRGGDIQILVATTVIEVGMDVPEATVMVIEDAQRFGISQLHQLRGRVGRAAARSYCVMFAGSETDEAQEAGALPLDPDAANPRLLALATTADGFELAERDLELRGEGSLFDTRQSGLPDLKLAKLIRDYGWVVQTREDARGLVEADPELARSPALRDEVRRRYGHERLAALETG